MQGYIQKALLRLKHQPPSRPQHAPHRWVPITYGKKIQKAEEEDSSPLLSPEGIRHIQQVVGLLTPP